MSCTDCGQDVPEFALTCPRCGHTVADQTTRFTSAPVTGGYADPQHYIVAHGGVPTPAWVQTEPVAPGRPKRRRLLTVLVGALALVLVGGGVAVAGGLLGWYGGGKRPSDVLPGSAISYAQIDLDPSLLQKTAAWQFLRDLPEVKAAVAAGLPDPKAVLWKLLVKYDDYFEKMNYDTEVKPWLGNRFGVVVVNHAGKGVWAAAIQVTDADLGARTMRAWAEKSDLKLDVTLRDDYALLTETGETSFILGEIANGTLAENPTFAADFSALGEPGISAGWTDLGGWVTLSGESVGTSIGINEGRVAFATRFTADTLEIAGITRGFTGAAAIPDSDLGTLPADTGAAVSLTGGGKSLAEAWSQLPQKAKDSVADLKLSLPDDLVALLGNSLVLAASTKTIENLFSAPDPQIGLRVNSDAASRAQDVLHTLLDGATPESVFTRVDGSVLVAGTTVEYRDLIAGSGPKLSSKEWFTKALPDHEKATFAIWVDAKAALGNIDEAGGYTEFLSSLRGWGTEFVPGAAGEGTWSTRIVRA